MRKAGPNRSHRGLQPRADHLVPLCVWDSGDDERVCNLTMLKRREQYTWLWIVGDTVSRGQIAIEQFGQSADWQTCSFNRRDSISVVVVCPSIRLEYAQVRQRRAPELYEEPDADWLPLTRVTLIAPPLPTAVYLIARKERPSHRPVNIFFFREGAAI
jgi:hypothetical protein